MSSPTVRIRHAWLALGLATWGLCAWGKERPAFYGEAAPRTSGDAVEIDAPMPVATGAPQQAFFFVPDQPPKGDDSPKEFNNEAVRKRKAGGANPDEGTDPSGPGVKPPTSPAARPKKKPAAARIPSAESDPGSSGTEGAAGGVEGKDVPKRPARVKIPTIPAEGPPDKVWNDYFKTHQPDPVAVSDVVLRLSTAKKVEHVIACLEAAITHGYSQPWMYTVLALTMKNAGRPQEEIERVLLSTVDFSAVNVDNLIFSGAFLTRYGAKARALELYRQASLVDITRLEPYVLGLKLASEQQEPESVVWAATGILTRAWNKDHERLHRDAEATLNELEATLRKAGRAQDADRVAQALAEALQRDLAIELSWSGTADLDLLIEEPSGAVCSSDNPATTGGGVFVHDGQGVTAEDAYDRYVCPRGMPGDYRAIIRYVRGEVVGKRAVLRIVRYQGSPREVEERFTVQLAETDKVVRVSLTQGRLKDLTAAPLLDAPREDLGAGKRNARALVGREGRRSERAGAQFVADRERRFGAQGGVGYQPVITVLNEGATMSALAVVSGDRRYVRLSLNPFFSAISAVSTFSFINGIGGGGNIGGGGPGGGGGGPGAGGGGGIGPGAGAGGGFQ
ncbi:MAG: hypothetical protein ACKV0T_25290 [Planctomycetales bacterium]